MKFVIPFIAVAVSTAAAQLSLHDYGLHIQYLERRTDAGPEIPHPSADGMTQRRGREPKPHPGADRKAQRGGREPKSPSRSNTSRTIQQVAASYMDRSIAERASLLASGGSAALGVLAGSTMALGPVMPAVIGGAAIGASCVGACLKMAADRQDAKAQLRKKKSV